MLNPVDFGLEGQDQATVGGKQHGGEGPVQGEQSHDEKAVVQPESVHGHGQAVDVYQRGHVTGIEQPDELFAGEFEAHFYAKDKGHGH